jgi:hypothetical protein
MTAKLGDDWINALAERPHSASSPYDPQFQLKLLRDKNYVDLAKDLDRKAVNLVHTLNEDRNHWFHGGSGLSRAHSTLEHIERLLDLVGAGAEAAEVDGLLREVTARMAAQQGLALPSATNGRPLEGVVSSLWISIHGQPTELEVNDDHMVVFDFEEADAVILRLTHSRFDIQGFEVNRPREVRSARNYGTDDYRDYRRVVKIRQRDDDPRELYAPYPENSLHVVELTSDSSRLTIYEASLQSHPLRSRVHFSNRFYLHLKPAHADVNLYQLNGKLHCPRFERKTGKEWRELVSFIAGLVDVTKLPERVAP